MAWNKAGQNCNVSYNTVTAAPREAQKFVCLSEICKGLLAQDFVQHIVQGAWVSTVTQMGKPNS